MADMKDDLGLHLELKANLASDKLGVTGCVTFQFGVNKMPTLADVNDALAKSIDQFNKTTGADDARLTTLRDFGFADEPSMAWPTPSDKEGGE